MKGFTLIEVAVSLGIIAIIVGISMPVYKIMRQKNDLRTAEFAVVSALRRAQILAQAEKEDSDWSVHIENSRITVFKGRNYANRDTSGDESFFISSGISTDNLTDIFFNKLTGLPGSAGLITLSISNDSKNITINEKGAIEY